MIIEFDFDDRGVREAAKFVDIEFGKLFSKFGRMMVENYRDRAAKVVYRNKNQEWKEGLFSSEPGGESHKQRIRESMGFRTKIFHFYTRYIIDPNNTELGVGDFRALNAYISKPYKGRAFPVWYIYEFGVGVTGPKHRPIFVKSRKAMVFYWKKKWIRTHVVVREGIKTDLIGTVFGDGRKLPSRRYFVRPDSMLATNRYWYSFMKFRESLARMFRNASWFGKA